MKFPILIIKQEKLEKLQQAIIHLEEKKKELLNEQSRLVREYGNLEQELLVLKERIPAIVDKLIQVSVQKHPNPRYPHFRVVTDISTEMLESGLLHGNDREMIRYIGEDIGKRVMHELLNLNTRRWEQ